MEIDLLTMKPNLISEERLARLSALKIPDPLSLLASLEIALEAKNILGLEPWIATAFNMNYNHPGQDSSTYFLHPLRVAKLYVENVVNPTKEGVILAIFHNALEVSTLTEKDLEDLLGRELAEDIKILTVDRKRQWDFSYKESYYAGIAKVELRVGQVKINDKLDNLYTLCLNPDSQIRENYLVEIERWIIPIAKTLVPTIHELLLALIVDNRKIGYRSIKSWL